MIFSKEFFFMRHGETDFNTAGKVTGGFDVELSDIGKVQAIEAAGMIAKLKFGTCIASPMRRVIDTAKLAGIDMQTVITVNGLEERSWGNLEGVEKTRLDDYDFEKEGVESWAHFTERTINALLALELQDSLPAMLVAHSGTYRVLCEYLQLNIPKVPVLNARPYRFYKDGDQWKVQVV